MEIISNTIQRYWVIRVGDEEYIVDYLNSDTQCLGLANRDNWMVYDKDDEEVCSEKDSELVDKLIALCHKNFEIPSDLKPKCNKIN